MLINVLKIGLLYSINLNLYLENLFLELPFENFIKKVYLNSLLEFLIHL